MIRHIGVHRPDHDDVIDMFSDFRKKFADFDAALSVFLKLERRLKCSARATLRLEVVHRQRFAVQPGKRRFRIESVHMGRTAIGKDVDDPLCLCGKLRRPRSQWRIAADPIRYRRPRHQLPPEQARETHHPEPHAAPRQKVASCKEEI